MFFTFEMYPNFDEWLMNEKWLTKLYLSDIFSHLNQINSSMQGPTENILTSCSKLFTLKDKLKMWKYVCKKVNFTCSFHYLWHKKVLICDGAFTYLRRKFRQVISDLNIFECDWINNSFDKNISLTKFSLEEEEPAEIRIELFYQNIKMFH